MDATKIGVVIALLIVIGVPFLFRPEEAAVPANAERLIIITPHNEQICYEFGRAFSDWHEREHGTPAHVDWRTPGGTSEIRKQLEASYAAALREGKIDREGNLAEGQSMSFDLMFGGGSYDHGKLVRFSALIDDERVAVPISQPVRFEDDWFEATYGENDISGEPLYHPEKYWCDTALSAFGIVYNRDALASIGIEEAPVVWADLTDYRYFTWIGLANPAQSGSIMTTYDAILRRMGWVEGWQVLRRCAANSRYYAASSSKVPIDVSQGAAAAGMCIDFYGRYQSQAVLDAAHGDELAYGDRVGYVDPPNLTAIDADPISLLRGAPHRDLAERFVEFCLTDEAQALWQFPRTEEGLGPRQFELRRMPVKRSMYRDYGERFRDQVNPFELAEPFENTDRNVRSMIAILFSSMAMDIHEDMQAAWRALNEEEDEAVRAEMLALFDALPVHITAEGEELDLAEQANLGAIVEDIGSVRNRADDVRLAYTTFFRENYREIVALAQR
ncbi:MAG: ABC transporter substrate-binding protein [Phycisphaerales bacterium JB038]